MNYMLCYPDYKDLATGKTLIATPGSAYTIAVASGRISSTPAYPNDGRWTSTTSFVAQFELPEVPESDKMDVSAMSKPSGPVLGTATTTPATKEGA